MHRNPSSRFDRIRFWGAALFVGMSLLVVAGNGYCGEFYGEAAYLPPQDGAAADRKSCLTADGLQICLDPGIIPSATKEFAVGLSVTNHRTEPAAIRADDFALAAPNDRRRLPRRKIRDFKRIMKKLAWGGAVVRQSMHYSFEDIFQVAPGETVTKLLRFYDPGDKPSTGRAARFGDRYIDLFNLKMPTTLTVTYRGDTVAAPRLHLLRYLGSDSTFIIHKKYGFEHEYLTGKPLLPPWKVALPVKAYLRHRDGARMLIALADRRFEITEQNARCRFRLGRFIPDKAVPDRITVAEAPTENDSGEPFTRLLDIHSGCILEQRPTGAQLTCTGGEVWIEAPENR